MPDEGNSRRGSMPNTKIETRIGWIDDPLAVIDAVQSALRDVLRLPEWDRALRLFEHAPTHFAVPPGKGPRYTLIEVTMFAGRSMEAKRSLYKAIVHNLGSLGVPAGDVKITLIEVPPENWGIRGGHPASEVDLGFEIKV
jgi:phenylpyruvate tautomerase PptA (4-oxalocrotonate tautomerase family)